jgi:hypothetical protein
MRNSRRPCKKKRNSHVLLTCGYIFSDGRFVGVFLPPLGGIDVRYWKTEKFFPIFPYFAQGSAPSSGTRKIFLFSLSFSLFSVIQGALLHHTHTHAFYMCLPHRPKVALSASPWGRSVCRGEKVCVRGRRETRVVPFHQCVFIHVGAQCVLKFFSDRREKNLSIPSRCEI